MICTFLELGQIVGTHGVRGELRINPWCDDPDFAGNFKTVYLGKNGAEPMNIVSCRKHKNLILMRLKGVDTVEAAEALRNRIVYIRRSDIILDAGHWTRTTIRCATAWLPISAKPARTTYGRSRTMRGRTI